MKSLFVVYAEPFSKRTFVPVFCAAPRSALACMPCCLALVNYGPMPFDYGGRSRRWCAWHIVYIFKTTADSLSANSRYFRVIEGPIKSGRHSPD